MFRIFIVILSFFIVPALSIQAQNKPETPSLEERQQAYESSNNKKSKSQEAVALETADKLAKKLSLNKSQTEKIYEVILKTDKEIAQINKSKKPVREKSMSINKANKEKLNSFEKIMTPGQFRDYRLSFP